jgi:hypothetical protein
LEEIEMSTEFPKAIHEKLKYYIYLYIDPRDGRIFYVGKGNCNRAFAHLNEQSEKSKEIKIRDMRAEGYEPRIEILVHGIETDEEARKIEASVIDLIKIENLTNSIRGYEAREFGRMSVEQIIATYAAEKANIVDAIVLININKTFRYGMQRIELYDATRSAWVVGDRKDRAHYALAIYQGIVQEVYEIKGWYPNNSTLNSRKEEPNVDDEERYEFVGRIADSKIRNRYLYKDVSDHVGGQNPIRYVNCP